MNRKQGFSFPQLSDMKSINKASLKYMVRLTDRYGLEASKKREKTITTLSIKTGNDW